MKPKHTSAKIFVRCFLTCLALATGGVNILYSTEDSYTYKIEKIFKKELRKYGISPSLELLETKDKTHVFFSDIDVHQIATIEEARELMVIAVEKLYQIVNSVEIGAKYLTHFPISKNRIDVSITFYSIGGLGDYSGNVHRVSKINNTISYKAFDFIPYHLEAIYKEDYEGARTLVSMPATPKKFKHIPFGYEDHLIDTVNLFTKEMDKKYKLMPIRVGGQFHKQINSIGVTFCMIQRTPLEQARALQVKCINRLLELVNADEKLRPYLKRWPMTAQDVEIRLEFWKHKCKKYSETGGYYSDGSMCYCYVQNGKISYFDEKPPGIGVSYMPALCLEESFEEATQKLAN